MIWLIQDKPYSTRLSCRRKIRNPFNGECKRDIPCAAFKSLQSALETSGLKEFNEPNFTSLKSVTNIFTIISGYNEIEVKQFSKQC